MNVLNSVRILVLPLALAACVAGPPAQPPAIPPIRAERIPAPPASAITLIWQPGHYDWDGIAYHWIEGEWVQRAGHGPLWQDGFWRREGGGYIWVPPHWL